MSFLALCGVLERALADGILGTYYLKGGVALELRFAGRARATKDLDLGLEGPRWNRLGLFREALQNGFDAFTFRVKGQTREMELADAVRVQVAVAYQTRAWQTIDVDLGPGPAVDQRVAVDLVEPRVLGLAELGIWVTTPIRCLGLPEQVAQKLHACTAPRAGSRARDILDILLIDLLGVLDYGAAASAAKRVFAERATHDFPPVFTMPGAWRQEVERTAMELGFLVTDPNEIEEQFRGVIARLGEEAGGAVRTGWA